MKERKASKPLTRQQYLKKFSRSARWRLSPLEAADAIGDYRELVHQEERDETKLVEELGDPIQAAWLLTDAKEYKRWWKIFAVLAFGLLLCAKWCFTGQSWYYGIFNLGNEWFPVLVMAVGLVLSLVWFRRYGQKSGPISQRLLAVLAVVLLFGLGAVAWICYVCDPEVLRAITGMPYPQWQVRVLTELLIDGGTVCALIALAGLVLARCYDRRWLALYALAVTISAMLCFTEFQFMSMDLSAPGPDVMQVYLFGRLIPIGIAGLIGTGVALC